MATPTVAVYRRPTGTWSAVARILETGRQPCADAGGPSDAPLRSAQLLVFVHNMANWHSQGGGAGPGRSAKACFTAWLGNFPQGTVFTRASKVTVFWRSCSNA